MRILHRAAEIEVTPQQDGYDRFGRFVARADLLIDGTRRLQEYDGSLHREGDVHEHDLARDRALLAAGYERYGYTWRQLTKNGAAIIADVDRYLGRTWEPRRLAGWDRLIDGSLLGRSGRARAYRQWRRAQP